MKNLAWGLLRDLLRFCWLHRRLPKCRCGRPRLIAVMAYGVRHCQCGGVFR